METHFTIRNDPKRSEEKLADLYNPNDDNQDIENINTLVANNNADIVVNLVNIADIINSSKSNIFTSNIVLVAIEPFILDNLTIKGIIQHVKITKDHLGKVFINGKEVNLVEISEGIKVLMVIRDESNINAQNDE